MQHSLMPPRDKAELRRVALRRFMKARGLKPADWARRAGLPSPSAIYNFLGDRSDSLSQDTLEALARAEAVTVSELIGETPLPVARGVLTVFVRGAVEAGIWREAVEWPEDEWVAITLPRIEHETDSAFALLVRGPSMNLVYPDGTYVICVPLYDFSGELRGGAKVVFCRRNREGLIESTVKELQFDAQGRAWLWPRSTDPAHTQAISIPWPPTKAPAETDDGTEEIEVTAVVIGSYRPETP